MFYLRVRDDTGRLNNLTIQRLKDKLGTRQLPTAELLLHGTKAKQVNPNIYVVVVYPPLDPC